MAGHSCWRRWRCRRWRFSPFLPLFFSFSSLSSLLSIPILLLSSFSLFLFVFFLCFPSLLPLFFFLFFLSLGFLFYSLLLLYFFFRSSTLSCAPSLCPCLPYIYRQKTREREVGATTVQSPQKPLKGHIPSVFHCPVVGHGSKFMQVGLWSTSFWFLGERGRG